MDVQYVFPLVFQLPSVYNKIEDPFVTYTINDEIKICRWSEVEKQQAIPIGLVGRHDGQVQEGIVEPEKY